MRGFSGFVAVFVAMFAVGMFARHVWSMPDLEAGALAILMWPVVERGWFVFGAGLVVGFIILFGESPL